MNCPYCGNAVLAGAAFCGNCGAKLDAATAPAGLPPQPSAEIVQEPMAPTPAPISASGPEPAVETMAPPPGFAPSYAPPPGFTASYAPPPALAKKSNTTLIIIVVLVVLLLCCCCGAIIALSQMSSVFTDVVTQMVTPTPRLK
jgi:hypothetical protein